MLNGQRLKTKRKLGRRGVQGYPQNRTWERPTSEKGCDSGPNMEGSSQTGPRVKKMTFKTRFGSG